MVLNRLGNEKDTDPTDGVIQYQASIRDHDLKEGDLKTGAPRGSA